MRFSVETDHPVALTSPDHTEPMGTANDATTSPGFCRACEDALGRKPLMVCDLGCSSGNLVRDWHGLGHHAVGLEGSDYSKARLREAWGSHPELLFTCDISRPFTVLADGQPARFDIVTAFEVCEHLAEADLPIFLANVRRHLKADGLFLATIPSTEDPPWHRTVKPRVWWEGLFAAHGFEKSEAGLAILHRERPRGEVETCYAFSLKDAQKS